MQDGPERWQQIIGQFLVRHVENAGASGLVIGVSGGLDSAVVSALAVGALGKGRVTCFIMPAADSAPMDAKHAHLALARLGVMPIERPIGAVVAAYEQTLALADKRILGNTKSRTRTAILYAEAQARGALVCGTGNKSELLTGYFTKHGDGAADLNPIGDLYKTQVRLLAKHLKVPAAICNKAPSAGLHPGQTDEGDMGVSYDDLDAVLRHMELGYDTATIGRMTGRPAATVALVERMVRGSEHKRQLALVPKLGVRTVGIDWRRSVQWDA